MNRQLSTQNLFTAKDAVLLQQRIDDESNKGVSMNMKHVIIYYTMIGFTCKALLRGEDDAYFQKALGEDDEGFLEVRNKFLQFGQVALAKLEKDLSKYAEFRNAIGKVKEQSMDLSKN